jgi:hypothetical protein
MRALILTDSLFASRERALLSRLEVGLADEGIRVIHAVPDGFSLDSTAAPVFTRVVRYQPTGGGWAPMRRLIVRRLVRAVNDVIEGEDGGSLDIVHVFGGSAWDIGFDLARECSATVALEIWRAGLVQRARDLGRTGVPVVLMAPDPAIERALTLAVGAGGPRVHAAFWGVHAPTHPREPLTRPDAATNAQREPVSVMVVGAGRDPRAFLAAFEGLATLVKAFGDVEIFCDALAARRANVWAIARRLGLLHHLSLIEELEARRDMVLQSDMLVLPEPTGEQRSIVLDALANGVLVAAAADPYLSPLEDRVTACVVRHPLAEEWRSALLELAQRPDVVQSLARTGHAFVRDKRRASDYVRAVISAYTWMASSKRPSPAST